MKISITQYAKALFELTENKSQEEVLNIVKNFAETLKTEGQLRNTGKIIEKFTEIYNAANGIVEAEVVTASGMEQETRDKVEKLVKEKYQAKEVVIRNVVDNEIKGGIIIRVGDEVMDGSVESQLKKLKNILSK